MMTLNMKRTGALLLAASASLFPIPPLDAGTESDLNTSLANAIYHGIEDTPVQLENGRWEGKPYVEGGASRPSVGLVQEFSLQGDLDGDGEPETIVLLWQSSGGSGNFQYVAVLKNQDDDLLNVATAPVGDRVQLRAGAVSDGVISLDVVQQGEGDAACCPSQLARRSWMLDGGQLNEQEPHIGGVLSLEMLEGTEWILTRLKQDRHVPEEIEVTVAFSDGRIAGDSGCNRFSASIEDGDAPGQIRIGPAMGTRMACPGEVMDFESEFLELLGLVDSFGFMGGRLLLTGSTDSYTFRLKFEEI
jgi:heat shock protein HslJ